MMIRPEPQLRYAIEDVLKNKIVQDALYTGGFVKLMHLTEVLEAEGIIEKPTADILMQIALDFKVCLDAISSIEDYIQKEDDDTDIPSWGIIKAKNAGKGKINRWDAVCKDQSEE